MHTGIYAHKSYDVCVGMYKAYFRLGPPIAAAVAVLEDGRIFGTDVDLTEELVVSLVYLLVLVSLGTFSATYTFLLLLWLSLAVV